MGYHINLLKNKFKRVSIEFHHNRHKTSYKDNVIQSRDPKKPLLTLRIDEPSNADSIEVEETVDEDSEQEAEVEAEQHYDEDQGDEVLEQDQFIGFTNGSEIDDDHIQENSIHETLQRSYRSSFRRIKTGESNFVQELKRQQCRCTCHEDFDGLLRSPVYHNQHCLSFCENVQQPILKISDVVSHVNYIEPKEISSDRKGFWFFKRKHPLAKIQHPKKSTPLEEDKQSTISSAVERIEIIAQSTGGVESPSISNESDELTVTDQLDVAKQINNNTTEATSYARRFAKFGSPLISFSRSNSDYNLRETPSSQGSKYHHHHQQHKGSEPWKFIMNDISLHAALLSTGSRTILSKSSLNLVADFTSSKHDPQQQYQQRQRSFSNDSGHSELISFGSIPANQQPLYHQDDQQTINNENLLSGAIFDTSHNDELNTFEKLLADESKNKYLDSRPSTTYKSKISVTSGPLEKDIYKGTDTSAVYGGVFQDYNYSDESIEGWKDLEQPSRLNVLKKDDTNRRSNSINNNRDNNNNDDTRNNNTFSNEVLPLKISNRGTNRIF